MEIKENQQYISLQEAGEYCNYSQEYLSLRSRQGKLKSVKIGRNWVTTKEWLREYLETVEDYKSNFKVKYIAPPANLPVEASVKTVSFWTVIKNLFQYRQPRFAFIVGLALISLSFFGIFGKIVIDNNIPLAANISSGQEVAYQTSGAGSLLKEYSQWVYYQFSTLDEKFAKAYNAIKSFSFKKEKPKEELVTVQPGKEGMVVIPSSGKDEEVKKKITESFSDETKVEITDETSGYITPVFKEKEGDKYLYILVPVTN
jgi:hypothetical protein